MYGTSGSPKPRTVRARRTRGAGTPSRSQRYRTVQKNKTSFRKCVGRGPRGPVLVPPATLPPPIFPPSPGTLTLFKKAVHKALDLHRHQQLLRGWGGVDLGHSLMQE